MDTYTISLDKNCGSPVVIILSTTLPWARSIVNELIQYFKMEN